MTGFVGIRAAAPWLVLSLASGFAEEILVRGVIFRITEEGLGTWIALAAVMGMLSVADDVSACQTSVMDQPAKACCAGAPSAECAARTQSPR